MMSSSYRRIIIIRLFGDVIIISSSSGYPHYMTIIISSSPSSSSSSYHQFHGGNDSVGKLGDDGTGTDMATDQQFLLFDQITIVGQNDKEENGNISFTFSISFHWRAFLSSSLLTLFFGWSGAFIAFHECKCRTTHITTEPQPCVSYKVGNRSKTHLPTRIHDSSSSVFSCRPRLLIRRELWQLICELVIGEILVISKGRKGQSRGCTRLLEQVYFN